MNLIDIKLIIPGVPIVKKNSAKTSLFYKDKFGRRVTRDNPIHYYTKNYKEWAIIAVQACAIFKSKNAHIEFPITDKMNIRCLFFLPDNRSVDLTNLMQGTHDVLAGKAGAVVVPSNVYQIIFDDAHRYLGSVDGSRILFDVVNPRTEVFITNYKM